MKRFTLILFALFVIGVFSHAQENASNNKITPEEIRSAFPIKFSAYAKGIWAPVVFRGRANMDNFTEDLGAGPGLGVGAGPGWDSIGAAVGIGVWGSNAEDNMGFEFKIRGAPNNDGNYIALHNPDNMAYIWAKPFGEILKIQFGQYQWDDVRGKIGGIGEIVGCYGGGEDDIFQRLESDTFGALFIIRPPEAAPDTLQGLTIFSTFGVTGGLDPMRNANNDAFAVRVGNGLKYIFSTPHAGIAYKNSAFGFARFQFIGSNYIWGNGQDDGKNTRIIKHPWYGTSTITHFFFPKNVREEARMEFAVNITAIPDINMDIGLGIPFAVTVVNDDKGSITATRVGPSENDLFYRGPWTTTPNYLADSEGDKWRPPVKIALGLDYTPSSFNLRFRTKMEFGEKVEFSDGSDDFIAGTKVEFGLQPGYIISGIGTVTLSTALRVHQNGAFSGKISETGGDTKERTRLSYSHNGLIDLGLGAFFDRPMGSSGNIKVGICANIPLGGDRYTWSNESVSPANANYFTSKTTEAYRKGNLVIAVPIIMELSL